MIVADASIVVPLLVRQGVRSDHAEDLRGRDSLWIAPPLWRSEVLNALAKYMRVYALDLRAAEQAFERALDIVTDSPFSPDGWMLRLVAETGCSAYDAEYAALAISTGAPLVSNDRRLVSAFRSIARTPEEMLAE
jgi:predicted nucleic acid-binding protein